MGQYVDRVAAVPMMRRTSLTLVCLALLSGCEPAPEPAAEKPESAAPAVVSPAPEAPADVTVSEPDEAPAPVIVPKPEPAEPAKPKTTDKPQAQAKPPAKAKPAVAPQPEPRLALDLSVPQELFEQALESETSEELAPLLPPLFGDKPEGVSPFQISGRLINNERVGDYWDSIEGAELQFEFRQ